MIPHRYRIHLILICVVLVIIFMPHVSDPPDEHVAQLANESATKFLEQVDAGNYRKSWDLCAAVLKNTISQEDWDKQIRDLRAKAGTLVERTPGGINYSNAPAEDPDGKYLLVEYDSKFARTEQLTEAITMTQEKDGQWRVAGYHITK